MQCLSRCAAGHAVHSVQARVYVPDERFNWLCDLYKPKSNVAAFLDIVDIAGLVKYACLALHPLLAASNALARGPDTGLCSSTHGGRASCCSCAAAHRAQGISVRC